MHSFDCPISPNDYYRWKCVSNKWKDCKHLKPLNLKYQESNKEIKVSQFELMKTPYKKTSNYGEVVENVSLKTEKVDKTKSFKEIYNSPVSLKKILLNAQISSEK